MEQETFNWLLRVTRRNSSGRKSILHVMLVDKTEFEVFEISEEYMRTSIRVQVFQLIGTYESFD